MLNLFWVIEMEIFYKKDTLYVDIDDYVDQELVRDVRRKVFSIIDDYDIDNIVLNIIGDNRNSQLLDDFIDEYRSKYGGNMTIK